jgi:hypothetical protein
MPGPWEKYAQKSPQDGPWAKYATTESAQPPASPPEPQPTIGQQAMSMAKDFGTGILKGAGSTANNIGHLLYPDFIAKHLTGAPSAEQQEGYFAPKSTSQAVGKGLEQVGEFFVPGGAEKMAGEKLATMVPKLAKFAAPIARMAGTEAVNEAQGGTPGVGAAGGAAGELVGAGLHALAPYAAETAMRIPMAARAFGRTPGKAILAETRGVRPSTVGRTAQEALDKLNPDLESAYAASPNKVSLKPARDFLNQKMDDAVAQNAAGLHGQYNQMANTLAENFATKQRIPEEIPALDALKLKRGFGEEHTSWNPEVRNKALSAGRQVYGMLDRAGDAAVPGAEQLNQRISSLLPVAKAADKLERSPSLFQRTAGKVGAHTGALTLSAAGAAGGYKEGGTPGAIVGGLAGLVGPELAVSPESQMMAARLLNTVRSLKPVTGMALQADRSKRKDKEGQSQ